MHDDTSLNAYNYKVILPQKRKFKTITMLVSLTSLPRQQFGIVTSL